MTVIPELSLEDTMISGYSIGASAAPITGEAGLADGPISFDAYGNGFLGGVFVPTSAGREAESEPAKWIEVESTTWSAADGSIRYGGGVDAVPLEQGAIHSSGGAAGGIVSEGQGYGLFIAGATAVALGRGDWLDTHSMSSSDTTANAEPLDTVDFAFSKIDYDVDGGYDGGVVVAAGDLSGLAPHVQAFDLM